MYVICTNSTTRVQYLRLRTEILEFLEEQVSLKILDSRSAEAAAVHWHASSEQGPPACPTSRPGSAYSWHRARGDGGRRRTEEWRPSLKSRPGRVTWLRYVEEYVGHAKGSKSRADAEQLSGRAPKPRLPQRRLPQVRHLAGLFHRRCRI